MKKIFLILLSFFVFSSSSHAATEDELLTALTDLNDNLSYIKEVIQNSAKGSSVDNGKDYLPSDYILSFFAHVPESDTDVFWYRNYRGGTQYGYNFWWYFTQIRDQLVTVGNNTAATTNELVKANEVLAEINDKISSNRLELAEIAVSLSQLKLLVPVVSGLSSDISEILSAVSYCTGQLWEIADYARKIFDLMSIHYDIVENQLRQIYDKIGDLNVDFTNTMAFLIGEGISINGSVELAVPDSPLPVVFQNDIQFPDYSYLYDWYTKDTWIQGNEYTGYYQPLMGLSGSFYGRHYERWNKNYSQSPLNFFRSREQGQTSDNSYSGVDGWYQTLIRLVDDNGAVLEANNSLLAFIAAKLSETNTVSTNEVSAAVVNAASSGSGFQTSFDLDTPDIDNPLPDWSGSSLPESVYFGTLYLGERQIVFSVPTDEFAVFFTLIRTGFQLTYWGLVLAFFWFAFRVLRWVCPYLAAVVHWLLQFN